MNKKKYILITQKYKAKALSAYVIINMDGKHIATIHVYHTPRGKLQMDIFENVGFSMQLNAAPEEYPYAKALDGVRVDKVRLFKEDTPVSSIATPIAEKEKDVYLPGLDRLKALGYQVIQAL